MTEAEWVLIGPADRLRRSTPPAKRGGNARTVDLRAVVNGLRYGRGTAWQWWASPKDLPPRSMLHGYLTRWELNGTPERET